MRPGLVWLACLGSLPLIGLRVAFSRPFSRLPVGSRLALAGGVGAFILSTLMTVFAALGIRWHWAVLGISSVVVSALIGELLSKDDPIGLTGDQRHGAVAFAGAFVSAGGVAAAVLSVVAGAATSGDLILFWGPKAQAFAAAATIDPAFLGDRFLDYLHTYYPPLVTNIFAFASMVAGRFSWGASTATFPLILAGLALALPGIFRLSVSRACANAIAAVVVCGLAFVGTEADIAGNGEMPLLFFETLAMALLIAPAAVSRPPVQLLAGLFLGGAVATKVEGLPFALGASLLFVASRPGSSQRGKALFRLLAPAAIATAAWFVFGARTGLFRGYQGYGDILALYPGALMAVLAAIARALWHVGYGLPFLVPLVLLTLRPGPWRPAVLPLGTALLLAGFLVFTYLHVPDPALWIDWSAARVFAPLIPLISLAAAAPDTRTIGRPAGAETR